MSRPRRINGVPFPGIHSTPLPPRTSGGGGGKPPKKSGCRLLALLLLPLLPLLLILALAELDWGGDRDEPGTRRRDVATAICALLALAIAVAGIVWWTT